MFHCQSGAHRRGGCSDRGPPGKFDDRRNDFCCRDCGPPEGKTRPAIIGLDHDHVWELLMYISREPDVELVAIAEHQPELVKQAKSQVPDSVKFDADLGAAQEPKPMVRGVRSNHVSQIVANRLTVLKHIENICDEGNGRYV